MALYKAVKTCLFEGFMLAYDQQIYLTDKIAKKHGLGEFAQKIPDEKARRKDPNSKKMRSIGFEHLVKVNDDKVPAEDIEMQGWSRVAGMLIGPEPPKFDWERNLKGPAGAAV